jgi:hypothetical protein
MAETPSYPFPTIGGMTDRSNAWMSDDMRLMELPNDQPIFMQTWLSRNDAR